MDPKGLKIARSPVLHFLAIGATLFVLTRAFGDARDPASYRIVIGPGQVETVMATFMRAWKRPPTPRELRGLLEEHVKQEIYFREAIALGLDRDDIIVRRRLRQKMEFVAADATANADPEAVKRALYERLRGRYTVVIEAPVDR